MALTMLCKADLKRLTVIFPLTKVDMADKESSLDRLLRLLSLGTSAEETKSRKIETNNSGPCIAAGFQPIKQFPRSNPDRPGSTQNR